MAAKLSEEQREARTQRVKALRVAAREWEGVDKDYAAQLHVEAAAMANDPDFADMDKQSERRRNIAERITAEAEKAGAEALLIARATQQSGRKGGLIGGRPARTDWHTHALELANTLDTHQYRFKVDIATEVINGWKEEGIDPPGHRALCDKLSEWEKNGKLKPRT